MKIIQREEVMTEHNTTLAGQWVLIPGEGNYGLVGQVTLSIGDFHLLKIFPPAGAGAPSSSQLMSSDALADKDIRFFDTETELEIFLNWDPDGDRPKVVQLRK